jgi:hypothetical protein
MEQSKEIQIEYRLAKLDINKFDIHPENLKDGEAAFQTEVQFAYSNTQHSVRCRLRVNLVQEGTPLMESEVDCHFELNLDSVNKMRQDENVVIPAPILIQFASLCYGTMRGIIHTKTMETPINRFILPPIYFHEIIKQDYMAKL